MREFIGRLIDMLQVDDPLSTASIREGEMRARAMLEVSTAVLHAHMEREAVIRLFGEMLDLVDAPDRERTALSLAALPAEQLADTLLGFLRQRDATDPVQATGAHADAGAMVLAAAAFLQERHGTEHMTTCIERLVQILQEAAAAGREPVSAPAKPAPVLPAPDAIREALAQTRIAPALKQRVATMADFLRASAPAEGQAMALASFMAAGLFLRERQGEAFALDALRHVESTVSQQAALDRWQPESRAAH